MKKWLLSAGVLASLSLVPTMVLAQESVQIIQGAGMCGLKASDGSVFSAYLYAVITVDEDGTHVDAKCWGYQPTSIPAPANRIVMDYASTGTLCDTPFGQSKDWREVIRPNGYVTWECHVEPAQDQEDNRISARP